MPGATGMPGFDHSERIRELNEQILDSCREAGGLFLDAYEATLDSIAGYQEEASKQAGVDWMAALMEAHARFTRELARLYVSAGRELLS